MFSIHPWYMLMPCWIIVFSNFAGYCQLYPSAVCDVKHTCGLNHNFFDVLEKLLILRTRNCVYKFSEAVGIIWIEVDNVNQIYLPFTGGQLHTFETSPTTVAELPNKYHNKVNTILIPTYFDIVLLQGSLRLQGGTNKNTVTIRKESEAFHFWR
jgi:hypothetical protein